MSNPFIRSQLVLGEEGLKKIANARVAVFGVGGVGGYVIEALARCGIGEIDIIDNDTVAESNINRQIIATHSTIGEYKVDVMEKRIKDISPDTIVHKYTTFYLPENRDTFDFTNYDYIVDAIDTVTAKIDMICYAKSVKTPIISCMGCGNRMDPTQLELTDIYKTKNDPLAKVMRHDISTNVKLFAQKNCQSKHITQNKTARNVLFQDPPHLFQVLQDSSVQAILLEN